MSIYLGYCIIFIPPLFWISFSWILFTIEFLVLRVVEEEEKKIYRTPSNQWIPLPYYGCLLYIKKKEIPSLPSSTIYRSVTIIICACYGVPPLLFHYLFWIKIPFSWIGSFSSKFNVLFVYSVCRICKIVSYHSRQHQMVFKTEIKLFLYTLPILMVE